MLKTVVDYAAVYSIINSTSDRPCLDNKVTFVFAIGFEQFHPVERCQYSMQSVFDWHREVWEVSSG